MSAYRWASVVRVLEDHADGPDRGTIRLVAGKNENGYQHTIRSDIEKGFVDLECEVLGRVGPAPSPRGRSDIINWASEQDEAVSIAKGAPELKKEAES